MLRLLHNRRVIRRILWLFACTAVTAAVYLNVNCSSGSNSAVPADDLESPGDELQGDAYPQISQQGDKIIMENDHLRYVITTSNKNSAFIDQSRDVDYLNQDNPGAFVAVQKNGEIYTEAELSLSGRIITVNFSRVPITANIEAEIFPNYITLKLTSISDQDIDFFQLSSINTNIKGNVGTLLNVAFDDFFGALVLAATRTVEAKGKAYDHGLLWSACRPFPGLVNSKIAIVGSPREMIMPIIEEIEEAEPDLPYSTLDGEWSKTSSLSKRPYLFLNVTPVNVDDVIEYAKAGGFGYIMILQSSWTTASGHYDVRRDNYPRGEEDLKMVVDKIHSAGMKAGVHLLTGMISKGDSYVTPKPDTRLGKDGTLTLAADINESADFIPTVEMPEGFLTEAYYGTPGGVTLQIGDELITYSVIGDEPPYGFKGLKRGAFGTQAAAHSKGASVNHLAERYNMFIPDMQSTLPKEIADRIAHIVGYCGFDAIYYDGSEGMAGVKPGWYASSIVPLMVFDALERDLRVQGSGMTHLTWHLWAMQNGDDHAKVDPKGYCDRHKVPHRVMWSTNNLMSSELGWWGFLTGGLSHPATTPDEIEYLLAKAAGYDVTYSVQTDERSLRDNDRLYEALFILKAWTLLREWHTIPESVKEMLREPGEDFTLHYRSNRFEIVKMKYGPEMTVSAEDAASVHLDNPFESQPFRFRLYSQGATAPYGSPDNLVLIDPATTNLSDKTESHSGATSSVEVIEEATPEGEDSYGFKIETKPNAQNSWAGAGIRLSTPLDMSKHRRLGIWVKGDASGAILSVLLEDPNHMARHYFVRLDFTGWKYFYFAEPTGSEGYDYTLPYIAKRAVWSIDYRNISHVHLYLIGLPPGAQINVEVGRVEALKERIGSIRNPSVEIAGERVSIPVIIDNDEYIELHSDGICNHYDENGSLLRSISASGSIPTVSEGENEIKLFFETGRDSTTLKLIPILQGPVIWESD